MCHFKQLNHTSKPGSRDKITFVFVACQVSFTIVYRSCCSRESVVTCDYAMTLDMQSKKDIRSYSIHAMHPHKIVFLRCIRRLSVTRSATYKVCASPTPSTSIVRHLKHINNSAAGLIAPRMVKICANQMTVIRIGDVLTSGLVGKPHA